MPLEMKSLNTNFATAQVTVAATATLIVAARAGRDTVIIENAGTTAVYIGGSGVTTATGMLLPGVLGASIAIETTAAVYGITASGTQAVTIIENF
jgi:hypothetical protein